MVDANCILNGQSVPCETALNGAGSFFGALFGFLIVFWIIMMVFIVLMVVSNWIIYKKAGKPGWAAIIPIYNLVVLLEIIKKPIWWIILLFIPFVNFIIMIIMLHNLSKVFGKDVGFTLGLLFLPFIFYPILAFGKATYLEAPTGSTPSVSPISPVTPVASDLSTPSTTSSSI